jgi:hypothetical protein
MVKTKTKLWNAARKGRYKGDKGRYWDYFSDKIRIRDFYNYGKCISCGKRFKDWNEGQAGHYIAAGGGGFALLFSEDNVHLECNHCNGFNSNHQITYADGLDERYGKGTAEALKERYKDHHFKGKITKEWTKGEYKIRLEELKEEVTLLAEEHGLL